MTREEYLSELKNKITSLTDDEKAEALQYYSDYFEDADDDEKVMAELGSPDEAAAKIMENFSNALVGSSENKSENKNNYEEVNDNLCIAYDSDEVKSLTLNLGACHTVAIPGNKWMIETRGIHKSNIDYTLENGKLVINSVKKREFFDFLNHGTKNKMVPRILITVPENADIDELKIQLGAGLFKSQDLNVKCSDLVLNIGAGNLILKGISSARANIKCAMGNTELTGDIRGRTNIDCGMGAINLKLSGNKEDYSLDCKVGLGEVRFNGEKYSGVKTIEPDNKKENHISINCGMGSVIVK